MVADNPDELSEEYSRLFLVKSFSDFIRNSYDGGHVSRWNHYRNCRRLKGVFEGGFSYLRKHIGKKTDFIGFVDGLIQDPETEPKTLTERVQLNIYQGNLSVHASLINLCSDAGLFNSLCSRSPLLRNQKYHVHLKDDYRVQSQIARAAQLTLSLLEIRDARLKPMKREKGEDSGRHDLEYVFGTNRIPLCDWYDGIELSAPSRHFIVVTGGHFFVVQWDGEQLPLVVELQDIFREVHLRVVEHSESTKIVSYNCFIHRIRFIVGQIGQTHMAAILDL